ncbi:MAG: hypothetical protein DWQ04_28960 [Chloroflexi bacterium]|nr:MAG: hypothetical protein DWQ04_28960 [Chloroflexota bacterium]
MNRRHSVLLFMSLVLVFALLITGSTPTRAASTDLLITGVVDGPLPGGLPKAVEFYVVNDIADLSIFGFGSANNGGGTDGEEFTFPADAVTSGSFVYVATEAAEFNNFFGFAPTYTNGTAPNINGDDAIELFENGTVIDVFGDINVDGTGQAWEHLDGWAYRVSGSEADGSTFNLGNWTFSGINALDGETTNATAATPFPNGTYTPPGPADTAPTVSSIAPGNGATDVAVDADITVNFSEDVTTAAGWYEINCTSGGIIPATVTGGPQNFTLNPDVDYNNLDSCTLTIFAAQVTDADTNDPPDNMAADFISSFTTEDAAPPSTGSDLIIAGVIDGPLSGGIPKAIEVFVVNDIADLSIYGIGSANNGGGSDGEEFTFPAVAATAGDFIYVASESTGFTSFFGFAPDYTNGAASINGDDAIELFKNGAVVDTFGDINVDGNGEPWEYLDGWASRVAGTGPDGSTFVLANWTFSGPNALDGETTNDTAATPFPIGTYAPPAPPLVLSGVFDGPLSGGVPKGVELYVGQNIADLSVYGIGSANNGGGTDGEEFTFPAVAATAGDYIYVASESTGFTSFFGFAPDYTSGAASINGDDAIELFENGVVIDVFGDINVDGNGEPWEYLDGWAYRVDGTGPDGNVFVLANWTFSGPNALDGETTNASAATPFPIGTYSPIVSPGDDAPFVASTFPADGSTSIIWTTNIEIEFSEEVTVSGAWFDLNCTTSGAVTAVTTGGPQTYTLDPDVDLAVGETCTVTVFAAQVADNDTEDPPDNMDADATFSFTTFDEVCGDPFTPIYNIQGNGPASALDGSVVSTEGVVTATFYDTDEIGGFFLQDPVGDGDHTTSDGIYVFTTFYSPAVGESVRVQGEVDEFFDLTEITNVDIVLECGAVTPVDPTEVYLPVPDGIDPESYEGMLLTFPQPLVIDEYFNYDRFGEIVVAPERLFQPTAVFEPGSPEADALVELYARSRMTIDDGRTSGNPDPAIHPNGLEFTLDNKFRGGDTLENVTGVLFYSFGTYRLQPTQGADYTPANPRTPAPEVDGNITVASFNVLNYFTTLDGSGNICGPDSDQGCRGADNQEEFDRQRAKIISALAEIDADVVGLIEIENHPTDAAIADLVAGLNDVVGAGTYDYIATGPVGDDVIRVAFIYKPATVTAVGDFAVLDDVSFTDPLNTGRDRNRPALAQTFADNSNGGTVTVVVNHFKSKSGSELDDSGAVCVDGDPGNDVPDCDQGDGQGYFNATRTATADVLADWLATDPTNSGDADILIIGDLNAYDKEDPIDQLLEGADDALDTGDDFIDLLAEFVGEFAYTYVFSGQFGYLDYGLANESLLSQVSDAAAWSINADEPDILDYDTSFKEDAQDALYEPNAYRASDHDPVIVGLDLTPAENADGCYILAINGSPYEGFAEIVEKHRRVFNGLAWIYHEDLPNDSCLEIHGTDNTDVIIGSRGNDQIFGYGGRDFLLGYLGDDVFTGGTGFDYFYGGPGFDTVTDRTSYERCHSIEDGC